MKEFIYVITFNVWRGYSEYYCSLDYWCPACLWIWLGSWVTRGKITISGVPDHLNYCVIFIVYRCPRRNVPDFGRVFLMLNYTDITQNTYV